MNLKRAFLSTGFQNRRRLDVEIRTIITVLQSLDMEVIDFVGQNEFEPDQERAMMQAACEAVRGVDLLVAEVSEKAIGVGIEVGYAAALGIPVIYLRKADSEYSTTVGGLAAYSLIYERAEGLSTLLIPILQKMDAAFP